MPRRIRRNKEHEAFYKELKEGEAGIFESYKDILMMAAALGVKHNRRIPFDSSAEPIEWDVFSGRTDHPIVNAIALNETKDVNILLDDDETYDKKFQILEEYANGGFEILKKHVLEAPGDPLDNLLALIARERQQGSRNVDDPIQSMLRDLS